MRAATVIVGAIAAASVLIALAFILSPGDSSRAVTKTVIEKIVEAPEPTAEPTSSGEGGAAAQFGGPTQCGTELSVEDTSCELGEEVHTEYVDGHRGNFRTKDPETGKITEFVCEDASEPVTCTSEATGAVVYFGK
jgi:hypothetical protein